MKKLIILTTLLLCVVGCSQLESTTPYKPIVSLGGQVTNTLQGSYCWSSNGKAECVDMAGPVEILQSEKYSAIPVKPETEMKVSFNEQPENLNLEMNRITDSDNPTSVEVKSGGLILPKESGTYYAVLHGDWGSGKTSSYVFSFEIKE